MAPFHLHASAVAWDRRGLLFTGPSGCGKSALALDLLALGCRLIADDTVILTATDGHLFAKAAASTRGLIEARGLGILPVDAEPAPVRLIGQVDLTETEEDRLPHAREIEYLGAQLPLYRRPPGTNPAAPLLQLLKSGHRLPT